MGSVNRDVSPNTWLLPLAIVASTALGALITSYLVREPSAPVASAPSTDASALRVLEESQRSLTERVDELERVLLARELSPPVVVDDAAAAAPVSSRRATEPARDARDATRAVDTKWVDVLEKRISTALVERGLTPFDPGVAEPVRIAGIALRAADEERTTARAPWLERFPTYTSNDHDLIAALRAIDGRHAAARDEAIRQLEAQLDALTK